MSDPIADLRARVERLEARLAAATSEARNATAQVRRLRAESARTRMRGPLLAALLGTFAAALWVVPAETARPTPLKVSAPFEVVDASGKTIFRVTAGGGGRGFLVYQDDGVRIALLGGVSSTGYGYIKAQSEVGNVAMGMVKEGANIVFRTGGSDSRDTRAVLGVNDGAPALGLTNANKQIVVGLGTGAGGASGGGVLQLSAPDGTPMVEAGSTSTKRGVVRVYPAGAATGLGLPGTYLVGWSEKK